MACVESKPKVELERLYRPSQAEFWEKYLLPRKAVVLVGCLDRWKACQTWSPAFFKDRYGDLPLQTKGQYYTLADYMPKGSRGKPLTMGEFIDLVEASSDENPAPYLRNVWLEKFIPELYADIEPTPQQFLPNWLEDPLAKPLYSRLHGGRAEFYMGGRGGKFPVLHYDTYYIHTFLSQIYGIKEYTIFPPDQSAFLYPDSRNKSTISVDDIDHVDLEKFPLFAQATPIRVLLHPGEVLAVPAGWWHMTKIITPSITISMARVNSSNWADFSRDLMQHAPAHLKPPLWCYLAGFRAYQGVRGPGISKKAAL